VKGGGTNKIAAVCNGILLYQKKKRPDVRCTGCCFEFSKRREGKGNRKDKRPVHWFFDRLSKDRERTPKTQQVKRKGCAVGGGRDAQLSRGDFRMEVRQAKKTKTGQKALRKRRRATRRA